MTAEYGLDRNFADLILRHKFEIAQAATRAIILQSQKFILPASFAEENLIELCLNCLEVLKNYLNDGQLNIYKGYVKKFVALQDQFGCSSNLVTLVGDTIALKIKEAIARELPGLENEAMRLRFERRLERLITLGHVTALNNSNASFIKSSQS